MNYFDPHGVAEGTGLRCLGALSNRLVNGVYPMKYLTEFHYAHHLPGLTGRWMDTGATALGGAVRGSFHRLTYGHHLFGDGLKVLVNPELKFGHFLHHLGMDFLTTRGIPNPLLPVAKLAPLLAKMGLSQAAVSELLSVNLPKVLGGSLGLVCCGHDILLMFSDAIPHTWLAAGMHFGFGCMNTLFGLFPPNPLLLAAGAGEFCVSAVTAWRTMVDPVIPALGVPGSVFLPALGYAVGLGAILAACSGLAMGLGWKETGKNVVSAAAAAGAGTTAAYLSSASHCFLGPFAGPLAGILSYVLAKKAMDVLFPAERAVAKPSYVSLSSAEAANYFARGQAFPVPRLAAEPLGCLSGDRVLLNEQGIRRAAETCV